MKKSFLNMKYPIILILILTFAATNAQAGVDIELRNVSLDDFCYPPGDLIKIFFGVWNLGDETSMAFVVEAYASSDTTITEDDYYIGMDDPPILGPGEWWIPCYVYGQIPDDIPPGNYYVGLIALNKAGGPLGDENPENDTCYDSDIVLIDPAIRPDLILESVDIWGATSRFFPGEDIRVECIIKNIGVQKSGEYDIICYASADSSITEDDYRLGGRLGAMSLDPDEDRDYHFRLYFPDDIPADDYYIGGIISSCAMEVNLDNNTGYCSDMITIRAHPPDLIVQTLGYAEGAIFKPGDGIDVDIIVTNTGIGRANSYVVDYYASTDQYENGDYYIGNEVRGTLEPGAEDHFGTRCTLPDDIPEGDYYIGIIITWLYDSGSGNYERSSNYTFWVGPPVDLAVQSLETVDGTYLPRDQIVVYSLIKNTGERSSDSYTVDYYASTDATIKTSDYQIGYVNRSGLEPNEQHSYETTCQFPANITVGNYYIGIIITCPKEYDPANNVGLTSSTVEIVHPAGYVCGQMQYQDTLRKEHPIRYAMVKIYEDDNNDDPLDDRVIGQTHTDHNGNYGVTIMNDANSVHDIYVRVFTEVVSGAYPGTTSEICTVKDDVLDETYSLVSPLYPHPQDSSIVIDMTAPDSSGEFIVYDSVIEGFVKAKTFLGIELSKIATYWPCSEDTSYYDPCDVGIFIAQDDRGDRDVIMHEYGHYIADIYSFAQGSVGDNPVHFWDLDLRYNPVDRSDEEARNLAFREAWASLFSIATQLGDYGYPNSGDTMYQDVDESARDKFVINLEVDTCDHNSPGQYFENMNCCALWDIFDDNDDSEDDNDTLSDTSLLKIWTVTRDCQPEDIIDFWNSWFRSFNYESEITRIFQDHEMMFIKPETTRSDLNYDNIVNFHDFSKFAEHYPSSSGTEMYHEKYDLNNDNVISIDDLSYLVKDWLLSRQD